MSKKLIIVTRILILSILTSLILQGCGASIKIYSDVDNEGRFSQYKTYSFLEFTEGNIKTITEMELERIRIAFAREIELRGLHFIQEDGDVAIQITLYHRQATDASYGYTGAYNYMERALAVDMYDNGLRKHVWHSAAVGELVYDPAARADELPGVVAKIFENYPIQASTNK